MLQRYGLVVIALGGCSTDNEPAAVASFSAVNIAKSQNLRATNTCSRPGWRCETPTELLRMTAVYLAEGFDSGTGTYIGKTQAIYGNPDCNLVPGANGVTPQPDLASCSLDLGHPSSAGVAITSQPRFIDFGASPVDVKTALAAGRFAITPSTYEYIASDFGTNSESPPADGTEETLPAGVARNLRFKSPSMGSSFEIRTTRKGFRFPLESQVVAAGDAVEVEVDYDLTNTVAIVPEADAMATDPSLCTKPRNGYLYCIDVEAIGLYPVVRVESMSSSTPYVVITSPQEGEIAPTTGIVTYQSTSGASFVCTLNSLQVDCDEYGFTYDLPPGGYTFAVQTFDVGDTPAASDSVTFTVRDSP